jgi:predicted dehydrogenase
LSKRGVERPLAASLSSSLASSLQEKRGQLQVGIVGCGFIADHYVRSLREYPSLRLVGATDRDRERARRFGEFHRVYVYQTLDEMLADASVEIVLNLTNPHSHYEVSKRCLEAGRHVYSEKPLAMDFTEAKALTEIAKAHDVRISSAPCSLLGECAQTMWKALRENRIGRVRLAYAEMDDGPVARMAYRKWVSESGTPWPFKDEFEVGCTMEHAGYSLTWLAAFFGPAQSVTAFSSVQDPDKHPSIQRGMVAPDFSLAAIQFASGVVARLTCSILAPHDHVLRIIGDDGVLHTPDVWRYDAPVYRRRWMTVRRRTLLSPIRRKHRGLREPRRALMSDDRARGVAELANSVREHRPSRLSAPFALHVTELVLAIQGAGRNAGTYRMTTAFDPIPPMPWATRSAFP